MGRTTESNPYLGVGTSYPGEMWSNFVLYAEV